ncbi:polysaccharide pyruvyl transferase family protein [Sphingobacterium sp. UDSM-2020]|uniref:polysaccharide pyruvyl transferase family protein n=1 Tax=Sphingobacterium sp. UDSM-2020 TaxID=2795738 RepID=UPI0019383FEA|nr:polysaccharide pyruvyl transferase family protein [Sphingobacterium sp. UDSM-2020]QQD15379.1 polysaccharide pyruvyl transferase family protein [Sphingobacterium sp. UDSM-2020]
MVSNLLDFRAKYGILLFLQQFKSFKYFKNTKLDSSKNQVYIFLAADYGNLGDVAITFAQTKFLKGNSNFQVVEIPISQSLEGLCFVRKHIKKGDVVTTVGGGNMGDLYDQIEYIRQLVIGFFPNNKIISFPQTFDFSETEKGHKALDRAKRVYNSHQDLHIIAREQTSFGLMKKHYTNANVLLTPDIVLSLNEIEPKQVRKGAVICMRKDAEKSLSQEQNDYIIEAIHQQFDDVAYYDTHITRGELTVAEREEELYKIWNKFKGAELVITDRLHGMIFCYITGTPCLVFQNNNHKVRETYDWLKDTSYVTLMGNFSKSNIDDYLSNQVYSSPVNYKSLTVQYQVLKDILA